MEETATLRHTKWDCKDHVVFIPKYRRQALYKALRRHLGDVFRSLAQQKERRVEEGQLLPDHVYMLLSIPPKDSVAQIVGFIKGKTRSTLSGSLICKPPALPEVADSSAA